MAPRRAVVLGIPVDRVTLAQAVDRVFCMVDEFGADRRPRLVATVNVDFLVNALGWFSGVPRHPELVAVLREAELITADGMPVVWAARLLGAALPERVTGADLVPRLAREAALRGKSLYFLGGSREVAEQAARILQERNPGLRIAGIDSPFVHTTGEKLADADVEDEPILERINRSGADILLVGFGNPKQEMWFSRNRDRLRVPVSIGIGGAFNFITGAVARAPRWMQRTGLEWIFRVIQEPRRLWRRYALGMAKLGVMLAPSVLLHAATALATGRRRAAAPPPADDGALLLSGIQAVRALYLPAVLDAAAAAALEAPIREALEGDALLLDAAQVRYADAVGLGLLAEVCGASADGRASVYLARGSRWFRRLVSANRLGDLVGPRICRDATEAVERLRERWGEDRLFAGVRMHGQAIVLSLFGPLRVAQVDALDRAALAQYLGNRACVVDLTYCTGLDTAGVGLLAKIRREVVGEANPCILCSASPAALRMIRSAGMLEHFTVCRDVAQALETIAAPR